MSKAAQVEWEYRTTVSRSYGLVSEISSLLGWTPEQTDNYFLEASVL